MPSPRRIGQAELEVLRFIQENHPATVRQVAEHFSKTKGHVRTTILNVMMRLVHKKYLVRRKEDGIYRYSPRQNAAELLRGLVSDFVDRALGGSPSPFVAYLAEEADLTDADVEQLRKLVRELEESSRRKEERP